MERTTGKRLRDIMITAICVAAVSLTVHYHYYVRESYVSRKESGVSADETGTLYFSHPYAHLYTFPSPDGSAEFIWVSSTKHSRRQAEEEPEVVSYISELDEVEPDGERPDARETAAGGAEEVREIYYIPKAYVHFRFSDDPEMAEQELQDLKGKSELVWEKDM